MLFLAFGLNYLGMTALCLAMSRHHKALLSSAPSTARTRSLRAVGALLLAVAMGLNIAELTADMGIITGLLQLMLAGLAVGLLMAWRNRWVLPIGGLLPLGGLLALLA
ncbi:DUF3325 domain-containing protein [Pseudomonas sp. GV071]|jgi:hypothetical protein|uniref:DUF3325 domain-containing protein n=1 Tax=Pseudomonas sp. GV071 TaxID=2135754 RepID=UPI000D3D9A49|nr:DUF3325 domain-containing protein [Pseudomonas sp. GV071]PTQ71647.1 uncharacterized protein DUF3325 [Pseudomonas sp. GV071]